MKPWNVIGSRGVPRTHDRLNVANTAVLVQTIERKLIGQAGWHFVVRKHLNGQLLVRRQGLDVMQLGRMQIKIDAARERALSYDEPGAAKAFIERALQEGAASALLLEYAALHFQFGNARVCGPNDRCRVGRRLEDTRNHGRVKDSDRLRGGVERRQAIDVRDATVHGFHAAHAALVRGS